MDLGGVPERLTQFMFIIKFIQKRNLCYHLSSPRHHKFWENERNTGAREQCLVPLITASWEVELGRLWFKAILGKELARPYLN
jgi:hypothetical protein